MKIDIFSHVCTLEYKEAVSKIVPLNPALQERAIMYASMLGDMDDRFNMMDKYEDYVHILTFSEPPIEQVADPKQAAELARVANDSMAELVTKYPDRFVAAVASLPMNNIDAALKEVDRALTDLKLRGVQVYSSINDKPLDSPEFLPLYEKMAQYDLPIWIHPIRYGDYADYKTEDTSLYRIVGLYGWPHETTLAMARLASSGILAKYPNLKFITHHCGGTLPYLAGRIIELGSKKLMTDAGKYQPLTKEPIDYLKMFYGDTAIYGQVPTLMCGYEFFGPDHMLFGTDAPLGSISEPGIAVRLAINGIDHMDINESVRKKIYEGNAIRLLHLDIK